MVRIVVFVMAAAASVVTVSAMSMISRVMAMAVTMAVTVAVAMTVTVFPIMASVRPWYHLSMVRSSMIWGVVSRIVSRIVRIHCVR